MQDPFLQSEWQELGQRLRQCAEYLGSRKQRTDEFLSEAEAFASAEAPKRYSDLLQRVREAAEIAKRWQAIEPVVSEKVDEAIEETFPASDPPSFTPTAL